MLLGEASSDLIDPELFLVTCEPFDLDGMLGNDTSSSDISSSPYDFDRFSFGE